MSIRPCRSLASAVSVLVLAGGAGSPSAAAQADAVSPVSAQAARDARALAARIEADARRGSPAWRYVERVSGCCGVRAIEVRERARVNASGQVGTYFLTLVRQRHPAIAKVSIVEGVTSRGAYRTRAPHYELLYAVGLAPERRYWTLVTSHAHHADDRYTTDQVAFHHEEAELTAGGLAVLYGQAVQVLTKAEHHLPVSDEEYLRPGLPCGLPTQPACEPGGRW
jgi:hypothetical protein